MSRTSQLLLTLAVILASAPAVSYYASPVYRVAAVSQGEYDVGTRYVALYTVLELEGRNRPVVIQGHRDDFQTGNEVRVLWGLLPLNRSRWWQ